MQDLAPPQLKQIMNQENDRQKSSLNVLSVFDGMSCGQIALKEMGVKVGKYYAAEIDKYAIGQTKLNFPNTIHLGSVTDVKASDLEKIDLFIGGSPCQGFSLAGKQLNFEDPRSKLFFEFVRLWNEIKEINPDALFLLENVNMKREYLRVISEHLGVYPVRINSHLVSAQNRDRWYWTNIKTRQDGLFRELVSDIPHPKDRGILLKDILQSEDEVDEKYYLSDKAIQGILEHKKRADDNGWGFGAKLHGLGDKMNALKIGGKGKDDLIKLDKKGNIKADQDKAACFTAGGNSGGNHSDMDVIAIGCDFRYDEGLRLKGGGKSNCLMAKSGESLSSRQMVIIKEATNKGYVEIRPGECFDAENPNSETRRGRKMYDKSNCVMTAKTQFMKFTEDFRLRRLTPTECSRLQTIPEWYKWECSDTQQYKMLGNGWTVEVIIHIFNQIKLKTK